ncbi:nucleotidyl transferase AbiEii/AbiGii toxin family protein [Bradyrhizobium sp. UFLA05-153]
MSAPLTKHPQERKKRRDLFDLAIALKRAGVDPERIVKAFAAYMDHGGHNITRALFGQSMHLKASRPAVYSRYQSATGERIFAGFAQSIERGAEWTHPTSPGRALERRLNS